MDNADPPATLRISVAYSPRAGEVEVTELQLAAGATVDDALRASALGLRHPGLDPVVSTLGIWGKAASRCDVLRDRDRVEVYRPLQVDPKEARRRRQREQRPLRARRAG
jgi:putative ubiquitin-RnfH superfamily antitoxin RatB of RatAB toxin-antitoxin module